MGKRVLVIDDDRNAVKFLSAVLSEDSSEAIIAYDGHEGRLTVSRFGHRKDSHTEEENRW